MGHAVLPAELVEQSPAGDAELSRERAGRMVNNGVNDTAVTRARVKARPRMALENRHGVTELGDCERRREPGDAGPDDKNVD
jgi:hypothetical protein